MKKYVGLIMGAAAALAFGAQAAVVGYWQFEDSGNLGLDSSGNGLNATLNNTPVAMASSGLLNPIPQNGSANAGAVALVRDDSDYLSVADTASLNFTSGFTIETIITPNLAGSTFQNVFSQWNQGAANDRAWRLSFGGGAGATTTVAPQMYLSADGINSVTANLTSLGSNPLDQMTVGNTYYLGVAVDIDAVNGATVTAYLQDLTGGGSLVSNVLTSANIAGLAGITSLKDTAYDFLINGNGNNGAAGGFASSTIEEVRLSNTALSQSELLSIPEPSTMTMLLGATVALMAFRRMQV